MAAVASDFTFYLSGGDVNNDPDASLGGVRSDRDITTAIIANLFDNVDNGEASSGDTEYRCFYVRNNNPTDSIFNVVVWVDSQTSSADSSIEIGLDAAAVGDGKSTGVATTITAEGNAPGSVSFSAPSTPGTGLSIGTIAAGNCKAVWVKRIINASASQDVRDTCTIGVEGTDV